MGAPNTDMQEQSGEGTMTVERKPQVEVVRVSDAHAEALADFLRASWGDTSTPADVRAARAAAAAANPVEPGADVPTFIFLSDGKVLGHIGTIPVRFWNGTGEHAAHWFNGFMVLPEFRNGPIGYSVLKEAVRQLGIVAVLTVAAPSRRLFKAMGFVDYGAVPNHIAVLHPSRVLTALDVEALGLGGLPPWAPRLVRLAQRTGLAALGGAVAAGALGIWKLARGAASGLDTSVGADAASVAELDALWRAARAGIAASPVRDGAYLKWRYGPAEQGDAYEMVAVRDGRELVGAAAVRRPRGEGDPRLRGIKVATLSEIIFPPARADAGLATLAAAERAARALGADALLCTASHPALAALLPRRGFVRLPGNAHFMVRDPKNAHALPPALDAWWITRGDASADEVF
ncbi:MAG: GNAT family N-acetyltransferase [Gemmatimonadaceae bacterium]